MLPFVFFTRTSSLLSYSVYSLPYPFIYSAIQTLLQNGTYTIEDLLKEDDFIQETQGQSENLINYLTSFYGLQKLIYYLAVPQLPQYQDAAFRFPYMAAEALCCNVNPILDTLSQRSIESRDHFRLLFSLVQPQLLERLECSVSRDILRESKTALPKNTVDPFLQSQGFTNVQLNDIRPYMAGYFAKVVAYLCKKRPATLVRFLDRTPGIAKGLIRPTALSTAAIAALVNTLLDLPWYPTLGMGNLRLSQNDPPNESLPKLLLQNISEALDTAIGSVTNGILPTHTVASATAHSADIIATALHAARSAAPHEKFGVETYNAERLERTRRGAIANSSNNSNDIYGNDNSGESQLMNDPLSSENVQLDPSFHLPSPTDTDRATLRLLKILRDGDCAEDVLSIAHKAANCLQLHQEYNNTHASGAAVTGTVQTICDAAFRILSSILEACAFGWKHQIILGYDDEERNDNSTVRVPRIIQLLSQQGTEAMVQYLLSLSSSAGHTVHDVLNATSMDTLPPSLPSSIPSSVLPSPSTHSSSSSSVSSHHPHSHTKYNKKKRAPLVTEDILPGYAPAPSSRLAPSLGIAGLSLTKIFANFTRCGGWTEASNTISKYNMYAVLLDTMEAFPWHSILHRTITDAIIDTVRDGTPLLHRSLFFDGRMLTRVVETCKLAQLPLNIQQYGKRTGRIGYVGHIQSIANVIIAMYDQNQFSTVPLPTVKTTTNLPNHSSIHSLLTSHSGFWSVVNNELRIANIAHGVLIGGMAPDTKASGNVGAAADATGAAPRSNTAVDEIPGNVDGPDVEDRLSAGSGESDEEERRNFRPDDGDNDDASYNDQNPYLTNEEDDEKTGNDGKESPANEQKDNDSDNDSEEKFQFNDGEAIGADERETEDGINQRKADGVAKDEPVYNAFMMNDEDDTIGDGNGTDKFSNVSEWDIPGTSANAPVPQISSSFKEMDDFTFGENPPSSGTDTVQSNEMNMDFAFPDVKTVDPSSASLGTSASSTSTNDDFGFDAFGASSSFTTTATVPPESSSFDFDFSATATPTLATDMETSVTKDKLSSQTMDTENVSVNNNDDFHFDTENHSSPSSTEGSDFPSTYNTTDYGGEGLNDNNGNRSSTASSLTSVNEGQLVSFDNAFSETTAMNFPPKIVSQSPMEAFASQLDDDDDEIEHSGSKNEGVVEIVPNRRLSINKIPAVESFDTFLSTATHNNKPVVTTNENQFDDAFNSFNDTSFGTQLPTLPSSDNDPAFAGFSTPDPAFAAFGSSSDFSGSSTDSSNSTTTVKRTSTFSNNAFDDFTF